MWRRALSSPLLHCLALGWVAAWVVAGLGSAAARPPAEDPLIARARAEGLLASPVVEDRLERLASFLDLAPAEATRGRKIAAARALGLEARDPVLRRYLEEGLRDRIRGRIQVESASLDEIERRLRASGEASRSSERRALRHLHFAGFGAESERRARAAAAALGRAPHRFDTHARQADGFHAGAVLPPLSDAELAARFGSRFAAVVSALPVGAHPEPFESEYGWHAVEILRILEPSPAVRTAARESARRAIERERMRRAVDRELELLRSASGEAS